MTFQDENVRRRLYKFNHCFWYSTMPTAIGAIQKHRATIKHRATSTHRTDRCGMMER